MNPTLESIFGTFHTRLRRFILKRVNDEATAGDILQDVFLKIHLRMSTLQDSDRLEAWVYQIARNAIIDHYRRPDRFVPIDEILPAPEPEATEPDAAGEIAASMREMAESLPEPYREALLLTEFGGLSQQQLADRLGISLSGAKSRVQRARQKIRDDLLTCCHFEFDRYGRVVDFWEHCCCCSGESKVEGQKSLDR
jgi:RNA polymerase sigma-70 factor (ECF subfamily)